LKKHAETLCVIVAASFSGDLGFAHKYLSGRTVYVICADGGLDGCAELGLEPDLLVGDMDSATLAFGGETVRLPARKNVTDAYAAASEGLRRGYTDFLLLGCTGGRLDHFMGNIAVLEYLRGAGASAVIADGKNEITLVTGPCTVELARDSYFKYVSLVPLDRTVSGVTLEGFAYPLEVYTLSRNETLGISNEITASTALVRIDSGAALLIKSAE
jgi:thiamine pyrophosphokinase